MFQHSERADQGDLLAYCERTFLRYPWADPELPSLVYLDEGGRLAGFLGVIPRRLLLRGEPVRMAVATQFMVAPEHRGLAGRELLRAFLSGPQDLSYSDTANEPARRLWESVGARTAAIRSLTWVHPLSAVKHLAAAQSGRGLLRRGLGFVLRRAARPLDRLARGRTSRNGGEALPGRLEPFDATSLDGLDGQVLREYALRPDYSGGALDWLIAQCAQKQMMGTPIRQLVRDPNGNVAGWFVYCIRYGGLAELVQLAAPRRTRELVWDHLMRDARRRGAHAMAGRTEPEHLPQLERARAPLRRTGPWTIYHAERADLRDAIDGGDAFLSRFEGEWWLSF